MQEALTLFDSICNSRWFVKTSIVCHSFWSRFISPPSSFLPYPTTHSCHPSIISSTHLLFWPIHSQILFLNKIDLFSEKLPRSPLGDYFPDYAGGDSYDAACSYLLNRFVSLNQSAATKQIYAHYTCATDTQQIKCESLSFEFLTSTLSRYSNGVFFAVGMVENGYWLSFFLYMFCSLLFAPATQYAIQFTIYSLAEPIALPLPIHVHYPYASATLPFVPMRNALFGLWRRCCCTDPTLRGDCCVLFFRGGRSHPHPREHARMNVCVILGVVIPTRPTRGSSLRRNASARSLRTRRSQTSEL